MKYIAPKYEKETMETKDVMTTSVGGYVDLSGILQKTFQSNEGGKRTLNGTYNANFFDSFLNK